MLQHKITQKRNDQQVYYLPNQKKKYPIIYLILMSKSTLFLTIFLIFLFCQSSAQDISMILQVPAHVFRIESHSGGSITITLDWESDYYSSSTYLTMCLLKGGQYFDSSACRGVLTRTAPKQLTLIYNVPISDAYFLRIDCSSNSGLQRIKYTVSISSSNPNNHATYIVGYQVSNRNKIIRYFSGQISQHSYQKLTIMNPSTSNYLRSGSFNTYDAITFASDTLFNVIFDGPSDLVSQFTQLSNQQKCFIDISYEAGMFVLTLIMESITPLGLISDIAMLGLDVGTNDSCFPGQKSAVDVGGIAGGTVGGLAFFLCLACCCGKKNKVEQQ